MQACAPPELCEKLAGPRTGEKENKNKIKSEFGARHYHGNRRFFKILSVRNRRMSYLLDIHSWQSPFFHIPPVSLRLSHRNSISSLFIAHCVPVYALCESSGPTNRLHKSIDPFGQAMRLTWGAWGQNTIFWAPGPLWGVNWPHFGL